MKKAIFHPTEYFALRAFQFRAIFSETTFVWKAIPKITSFIEQYRNEHRVKEYYKTENVFIGKGTVIEEQALIQGPALIGDNCFIAHAALIREGCILGDNVYIGHGCEVKHSVILPRTNIAHLNYVGDSIVGAGVNVAGGAKFANFRFDKKPVRVRRGKELIETGLQKFGAIVGDGSQIGVNAVLNPGTVLGKRCIVYPLTSVIGAYEEGSIIK